MEPVRTRIGWADFGDYEHFGVRLHRDLVGRISYVGLAAFALTGRRLAPEDVAVLDDITASAHVPEPRVWPMKLTRLVGSLGRPITGYLAGSVVLDGDFIGASAIERGAVLILEAEAAVAGSADRPAALRAYVRSRDPWPGMGVHQRNVDERVTSIAACLERRGLATRRFWSVANELWAAVRDELGLDPNVFDAVAAACLDLALSPPQIGALAALLLQPQFLAHAFEGATDRAPALLHLPDECVRYVGPAPRESPRKPRPR